MPTRAYAAQSPTTPLAPFGIERRAPTAHDVEIDILFCGVCHSDLHFARNEWGFTQYPVVPGHEILGRVTRVGSGVTKFKAGDLAAVGCLVDSCRACDCCKRGLEQFCMGGAVFTYNGEDKHMGGMTFGGYSEKVVVDEAFTLKIPASLGASARDQAAAAPLLCAGITTWSPLKHWGAGPGKKVGIVGLGGLGAHGREVRARARCADGSLEDLEVEGRRRPAPRRARGRALDRRGGDGQARRFVRPDRRHRVGRSLARRAHGARQARRQRCGWSARRRGRRRGRR